MGYSVSEVVHTGFHKKLELGKAEQGQLCGLASFQGMWPGNEATFKWAINMNYDLGMSLHPTGVNLRTMTWELGVIIQEQLCTGTKFSWKMKCLLYQIMITVQILLCQYLFLCFIWYPAFLHCFLISCIAQVLGGLLAMLISRLYGRCLGIECYMPDSANCNPMDIHKCLKRHHFFIPLLQI